MNALIWLGAIIFIGTFLVVVLRITLGEWPFTPFDTTEQCIVLACGGLGIMLFIWGLTDEHLGVDR